MRAPRYFKITAKASLVDILVNDPAFCYLQEENILSVIISDRHGFDFEAIYDEIKSKYFEAFRQKIPLLDTKLGFDYYWDFVTYEGRISYFEDIISDTQPSTNESEELKYLRGINSEID